ncbi:MAG: V-type ATP synthase subunit I [Candidatus Aminicenantes bacterium]|nr:V-type ATP synthase subunit I [Candidatus Aminicenantes bacterium]
MAISEVQKLHMLAHSGLKQDVLSSLQEEGILQIERIDYGDLGLSVPSVEVAHLDHKLHRLTNALDYLSQWEERGFAKTLLPQKPQIPRKQREEVLKVDYTALLDKIENLEKEKNDTLSHIRFIEKEEELLLPLEGLNLPIKMVSSTESIEVIIGSMPLSSLKELRAREDEALWIHILSQGKRNVYLLLLYLKIEKEHFEQLLKPLDFNPLYFTEPMLRRAEVQDRVQDLITKLEEEKALNEKKLESLEQEGRDLASHREQLMRVHDVLFSEREKWTSSQRLGETEQAFFLEGWIKIEDIPKFEAKLRPYSELIQCYFRSPLQDEDPPIILKNPKVGEPFEVITKLYGLPQRGTLDPTLPLAPFFFLFVGLTVSEAGYGLLVALLSFLYLRIAKPKGGLRQFLTLLCILGVATVILGTLVGGWFGFPIRKLMVLDPLQNPVSFLILSLALGFIQVWFGTLLNMISGIKNKNYLQAIFVQGGWLLLLPSLVVYVLTKQPVLGILTLVGAVGIVFFASPSKNPLARFFGGLYRLYDISRYLADVLSYSRLLALGLATSVIAMVVNTLCQTALGIPWLGWLFAALIFVGGHLFNLGISFLGGFVHSMRLQFVEFFSKFFQSGGKPFKPFELESKYVEFI